MPRSRKMPTASTLLAGSLLAGTMAVLTGLSAFSVPASTGCATQEVTETPDGALPPCKPGPFIFCKEVPAETPGCNTVDGVDPRLSRLPRIRYNVGCVVDYVGQRDEQGNCKLDAVCKCQIGEIAARPPPQDDAGGTTVTEDAGDAGDAAPSPAPVVDAGPTTGPVWFCYP